MIDMDDPILRQMRNNKALRRWTIVAILIIAALNLALPFIPKSFH